jgi:hypothetical protein
MVGIPQGMKDQELRAIRATHRADPPAERELVGLAFSGGGIRSATFGLGVLQALKEVDLLGRIHYLSTVSGGGYIGAWFSANCRRARQRGDWPWSSPKADWDASIRHLRRYSNYLSPDVGFFSADTWSMFTVWLRNAMLVQWTVVMAVACVLLVPRLLIPLFAHWYDYGDWRWIGVHCFVLAMICVAGNQQWVSRDAPPWLMQASSWRYGVGLSVLGLAAVFGFRALVGFDPFHHPVDPGHALIMAALLVATGYATLPVGARIYALARSTDVDRTQINFRQSLVQVWIVFPLLLSGLFIGAVLWAEVNRGDLARYATYGEFLVHGWWRWPFPLSIVFCSLWLLSLCSVRRVRNVKAFLAASLAPLICVAVLHALLSGIMLLLRSWRDGQVAHAFVVAPPLVLFAFSITVVVLIGMMGRESTEGVREWWSRLGAWLLIYGAVWMIVAVAAVYGPGWVYYAFEFHPGKALSSAMGWIGTIAAGLFAGHSDQTGRPDQPQQRHRLLQIAAQVAPYLFIAGLLIGVSTIIDVVVTKNATADWWHLTAPDDQARFFRVSFLALAGCAATLFLLGFRIDINEFSLNAFYRNRLVRCFLGAARTSPGERKPQQFTGFDDGDDVELARLVEPDGSLSGPLPIVNCALNLGGAGDLSLHTRHSASFTLTPLYAGSDYTHTQDGEPESCVGFVPMCDDTAPAPIAIGGAAACTTRSAVGSTTLGRAIAVSGAAASPNMGYHTSPVVAFLLTVFNLRLGWWFPHPGTGAGSAESPRFNLGYMFAELFGNATYRSRFLMISDGGHFENLAVYELIKRHCAVIIASDAECDPKLAFEGLGTLIRMCEVDLGVGIDIDVGSLRPRADAPWSEQRVAVGTIHYPGRPPGTLIYLKAAMTGHEPTSVLQYRAGHPAFPHETTGDQFYSEDQFESYRRLGFEVAYKVFAPAVEEQRRALDPADRDRPVDMLTLAQTLAKACAPTLSTSATFTGHTQLLIKLWDKIRDTDSLKALDQGLVTGGLPQGSPLSRLEFYTCAEMIQLMENVYLDLQLEETWRHPDNHGWRMLFTQWAATPQMQQTWRATQKMFGERFRHFCRRELGLP